MENATPSDYQILKIKNLRIDFRRPGGQPQAAVQGIDLELKDGESLAIVGESGSGKSVTALTLARLLPEGSANITADEFLVHDKAVLTMKEAELRSLRGKDVAYVFQEPSTSLNPVLSIKTQMSEVLKLHRPEVTDHHAEIVQWLYKVGIVDPEKRLKAYPHELSGGMQQRVMIAMALCAHPKILIADEPTTALDVTIQKQIIDLLVELKASLGMSIILITHNFAIIRGIADKVAVMFRGKIVEVGETEQVLTNPQHPYTKALLDCVPRFGMKDQRLKTIDYTQLS